MDDQEQVRYIHSLQARANLMETRMNRMEALMRQTLNMLSAGASTGERIQIQNMLQELQRDPSIPPQERPEMRAIREALLSGDRMKAIKLYRNTFGVGLKEAQDALDSM